MSLLKVLKYPDKQLKRVSQNVKDMGKTIEELVESLFETMYIENGIGLAAPQVGELLRVIVVDVPIVNPKDPEDYKSDAIAMINPTIKTKQGLIEFEEGCLSCPDLIVKVPRADLIRVAYLNTEGRPCEIDAGGLKAVCIQHEIDHLDGQLLVDKVSRIERDMYRTKRVREAKDDKDLANVL